MIFHIDFHLNSDQFLSKFSFDQTFRIFFGEVLSTTSFDILTFCLPGQINSIVIGNGVYSLFCLGALEGEPLTISQLANAKALFFFLSLKVPFTANGTLLRAVFSMFSPSSISLVAVKRSEKIFLKVPTSTI